MPDPITRTTAVSRLTRIRYLLAALPVLLLLAGTGLRNTGLFVDELYRVQEDLGGDKVVHLVSGIALMAAGWLLCLPRSGKAIAAVLLAALTLLSLDELVQMTMPNREFDLLDLAAGGAGACLLAIAVAALPSLHRGLSAIGKERPHT